MVPKKVSPLRGHEDGVCVGTEVCNCEEFAADVVALLEGWNPTSNVTPPAHFWSDLFIKFPCPRHRVNKYIPWYLAANLPLGHRPEVQQPFLPGWLVDAQASAHLAAATESVAAECAGMGEPMSAQEWESLFSEPVHVRLGRLG